MPRDYYEVLGVERTATQDEIRKAYRRLAREQHPDVNPHRREEAEAHFKEIQEANNVLSDEQKRARYDRFGPEGVDGPPGGAGVNFSGGLGDIFEVFFGAAAGAGGRSQQDIRRGGDVRADLTLTLEECWAGVTKEVKVNCRVTCTACDGDGAAPGTKAETCTSCKGTGRLREISNTIFGQVAHEVPCVRCGGSGRVIPTPCPTCRGEGRVRGQRAVSVAIPAGVGEGDRVRVMNAGESGLYGGPPGDLYCFIDVQESEQFQRRGQDVVYVLPLSFAQASLGDIVQAQTLEMQDGKHVEVDITIPAGTQTGETFQIHGKGFPARGGYRGNQICVARVMVPKKLNERQKELLREFAEIDKEHIEEQPRGFFNKLKDAFGV